MEQLAQIAAQLGVDQTVYYLFGLMFVLYLILGNIYARPYQKLIAMRRQRTEGVKKEALELTGKAEEKFNAYKERLKEVTDKARLAMRENEEFARKEEAKILAEASNKAKGALHQTQKELDAQRKVVLDALAGEITGLASEIATKVMGRPIDAR